MSPVQRLRVSVSLVSRRIGQGLKLLGFKDRDQLAFEDNIKHSYFIYPDEMVRGTLFPIQWLLADSVDCGKRLTPEASAPSVRF